MFTSKALDYRIAQVVTRIPNYLAPPYIAALGMSGAIDSDLCSQLRGAKRLLRHAFSACAFSLVFLKTSPMIDAWR